MRGVGRTLMYVVNRLPETLRSDLVGIDFSRELNMFREAGQTEFRIGISQYQKTPHCYETCIFDWDHPFENVFWTDLFAFIERKYIENGNIPRDIGLRPQLIHYPRVFGGLCAWSLQIQIREVSMWKWRDRYFLPMKASETA